MIFYCAGCDRNRDSDHEDGTMEAPNGSGLFCSECVERAGGKAWVEMTRYRPLRIPVEFDEATAPDASDPFVILDYIPEIQALGREAANSPDHGGAGLGEQCLMTACERQPITAVSATGWAIIVNGQPDVRTVGPSRRVALANGLAAIFGQMAPNDWLDDQLEEEWGYQIGLKSRDWRFTVCPVSIVPFDPTPFKAPPHE